MRTAVIGGGASGMLTALLLAKQGHDVTIFEKNEKLGKKLYITGKGRCNLTNNCDADGLMRHVVTNPKFLFSAFSEWDAAKTMAFFESAGLALKTERGNRVFPVSDHASDVIRVLEKELQTQHVRIRLRCTVTELLLQDIPEETEKTASEIICHQAKPDDLRTHQRASEIICHQAKPDDLRTHQRASEIICHQAKRGYQKNICGIRFRDVGGALTEESFEAVVVATGGRSYPQTGSDGDGYRFAAQAGIAVKPCAPSLVPFETAEDFCRELSGLSLRNVTLSCYSLVKEKEKLLYREQGEMLFTHFGISGPLVLSASAYTDFEKHAPVVVHIDLKPARSEEQLDARILRDFETEKNKQLRNALGALLPKKLIPIVITRADIDPYKQVNAVTREERRRLVAQIKKFSLSVTGTRGYEEAIITRGGVSTREINPKTMEAKRVHGLYFIGEVLDTDALTGGFNLQIAWATAASVRLGDYTQNS